MQMSSNVWNEFDYRFHVFIVTESSSHPILWESTLIVAQNILPQNKSVKVDACFVRALPVLFAGILFFGMLKIRKLHSFLFGSHGP
jgi:hypothetical protein